MMTTVICTDRLYNRLWNRNDVTLTGLPSRDWNLCIFLYRGLSDSRSRDLLNACALVYISTYFGCGITCLTLSSHDCVCVCVSPLCRWDLSPTAISLQLINKLTDLPYPILMSPPPPQVLNQFNIMRRDVVRGTAGSSLPPPCWRTWCWLRRVGSHTGHISHLAGLSLFSSSRSLDPERLFDYFLSGLLKMSYLKYKFTCLIICNPVSIQMCIHAFMSAIFMIKKALEWCR